MATLHWEMRKVLPLLQEEGRLNVLIAMLLRCNIRMRCYPSLETMVKDTGLSIATVNRAKNWLLENKFAVLVPYKKRMDDELALPRRHNVYQLTGLATVNEQEIQYLFMTDVALLELQNRVRDTLTGKALTGKVSRRKVLTGKDKGSSSPEGVSRKNGGAPKWSSDLLALSNTFCELTNTLVKPHEGGNQSYELGAAATLFNAGVTPAILRQYFNHEYTGKYKPKSLQEIAKGIGSFLSEKNKPPPQRRPAPPPVATPTLTPDELEARKAQGRAARKQLLLGGKQ